MQHKSAGQWVMVVYSKEKLVAAAGPPWRGIETERERELYGYYAGRVSRHGGPVAVTEQLPVDTFD